MLRTANEQPERPAAHFERAGELAPGEEVLLRAVPVVAQVHLVVLRDQRAVGPHHGLADPVGPASRSLLMADAKTASRSAALIVVSMLPLQSSKKVPSFFEVAFVFFF